MGYIVIGGCVLYALWCLWFVIRNQVPREPHVIGAGVVEVLLLTQTVVAVVVWIADEGPAGGGALWISYLIFALLVVPVALIWALSERSRWGTAVLAAAALTVAVLVVRLQQIWDMG